MSIPNDQQGPTEAERSVLLHGLRVWSGSAAPTEPVARFLGFYSADQMQRFTAGLADKIADGSSLSREAWSTILACTELVFISDRYGSGLEWSTVTGLTDQETIVLLRSIQRGLDRWPPAR